MRTWALLLQQGAVPGRPALLALQEGPLESLKRVFFFFPPVSDCQHSVLLLLDSEACFSMALQESFKLFTGRWNLGFFCIFLW